MKPVLMHGIVKVIFNLSPPFMTFLGRLRKNSKEPSVVEIERRIVLFETFSDKVNIYELGYREILEF